MSDAIIQLQKMNCIKFWELTIYRYNQRFYGPFPSISIIIVNTYWYEMNVLKYTVHRFKHVGPCDSLKQYSKH